MMMTIMRMMMMMLVVVVMMISLSYLGKAQAKAKEHWVSVREKGIRVSWRCKDNQLATPGICLGGGWWFHLHRSKSRWRSPLPKGG